MSFGSKEVLRGLSFDAKPSEVVYIAGLNGAGKTTWLRIATGILRPTSGAVFFNGNTKAEDIRDKISVVFDEPPVYPHLSGSDNLRLLAGIRWLDDSSKKILADFQLESAFLKKRAGHYSFGQRHRLAMAAAILRRSTYLFLDEPAVGLDPVAWRQVEEGIRNMAGNGATILLTGQDFELVGPLADKIVILHNGIAVFSGSPQELTKKFPPIIRVRVSNQEAVTSAFPNARPVEHKEGLLEIICSSERRGKVRIAKVTNRANASDVVASPYGLQ
jgi:ABC-2 type transport system ATP-binding protein/Cu-processing system ATP-binding protein